MSEKRKICEEEEWKKLTKFNHGTVIPLEMLQFDVYEEIYRHLDGKDLKNLLLVSKTINKQIEHSKILMNKFCLKMSHSDEKSNRNYTNVKIVPRNYEKIKIKLENLNYENVENLEIICTQNFSPSEYGEFLDELFRSEYFTKLKVLKIACENGSFLSFTSLTSWDLRNLRELHCGSGMDDRIFKKLQCEKLEKLTFHHSTSFFEESKYDFIERQTKLRELHMMLGYTQNGPMKSFNLPELVKLTLQDERSFKQEPKDCSQLLNNFSKSLKKLNLIGFFSLETYAEVTGNLTGLTEFSLKTHKLPAGCSELMSNHSIETLSIDGLGRGRNLLPLMKKFPNVKNLRFSIDDRECWTAISKSMTKIEHLETPTISASNIIDSQFPKVKTLHHIAGEDRLCVNIVNSKIIGWRLVRESFPNVENLSIQKILVGDCDVLKIIGENWKGLKYLKIHKFENSTHHRHHPQIKTKTLKFLFRNCPALKRVIVPHVNFNFHQNSEILKTLKTLIESGLQFI